MCPIERYDVHQEWAHSGIIRAGDFCFIGYCAGNVGKDVESQVSSSPSNFYFHIGLKLIVRTGKARSSLCHF